MRYISQVPTENWLNFNDLSTLVILVTLVGWVFAQIKHLEKRDDDKFHILKSDIERLEKSLASLESKINLDNKDDEILINQVTVLINNLKIQLDSKFQIYSFKFKTIDSILEDIQGYLKKSGQYFPRKQAINISDQDCPLTNLQLKDDD